MPWPASSTPNTGAGDNSADGMGVNKTPPSDSKAADVCVKRVVDTGTSVSVTVGATPEDNSVTGTGLAAVAGIIDPSALSCVAGEEVVSRSGEGKIPRADGSVVEDTSCEVSAY
jgi:hypothetical protein